MIKSLVKEKEFQLYISMKENFSMERKMDTENKLGLLETIKVIYMRVVGKTTKRMVMVDIIGLVVNSMWVSIKMTKNVVMARLLGLMVKSMWVCLKMTNRMVMAR